MDDDGKRPANKWRNRQPQQSLGNAPSRTRQPPTPRHVTESYLRNSAMHYLSQRAASTSMLRQTLVRRAKRRLCQQSLPEEVGDRIDTVIAALVKLGLINDDTFAANRAASLARKGFSKRRIEQGLHAKGIKGERAARAIGDDLDELAQARRFAERKRLGSWRRGDASPELHQKDLRAMARAGFSLSTARKALEPEVDPED